MKVLLLSLVMTLITVRTSCQQSWMLSGVLKELHFSKELHRVKPIASANVTILIKNVTACNITSKSDGSFSCTISTEPTDSRITIAYLGDYELVDSSCIHNLIWKADGGPLDNDSKQMILLSKKGVIAKLAKEIADKVKPQLQKEFEKKAEKIREQYQDKVGELYQELSQLNDRYLYEKKLCDSLSIYFSRLDSASINENIYKAYQFYFQARFDSCLQYLSTKDIKTLGYTSKRNLEQAVFLSLLRGDLLWGTALMPNGLKDSSLLKEACDLYIYANELKEYKDLYCMDRLSNYLITEKKFEEVLPLLKKSLLLLPLDKGSLDDSIKLYCDFSLTYERLSSQLSMKMSDRSYKVNNLEKQVDLNLDSSDNAIKEKIDRIYAEWSAVLQLIFRMEKRILKFGNLQSRIALLESYDDFMTYVGLAPKMKDGSDKEAQFQLEFILKQLTVLNSFTTEERASSHFTINHADIHVENIFDFASLYLGAAGGYLRLKNITQAVTYFKKGFAYLNSLLQANHNDSENFEEQLQIIAIYFAVILEDGTKLPKKILINLLDQQISFLRELRKSRKNADEKDLCNDMIEVLRGFKTLQ